MKKVQANSVKFADPFVTAAGKERAYSSLRNPTTLWFNTGTLCNIECVNCYIKSSPENDSLVYLTAEEVERYLRQISHRGWPVREIGFTGGEPFMNPQFLAMVTAALISNFDVLILTNAMRPMMRKPVQWKLLQLRERFDRRLTLRVSLDHYSQAVHDAERGADGFAKTLDGLIWLKEHGFRLAVAGRGSPTESESDLRNGFRGLFERYEIPVNASDPSQLVIFPELEADAEVPEISTECWGLLKKSPNTVMCSSSRMVIKRKGATSPSVVACTLLPYQREFELGESLAEAEGDVRLNHPNCAAFCVLGGASCSPA
ncbi:MAG: radical SAM protein [Aestuariivita sp.]|nr:radical SAM protein [Aestuariivita sp.]MCY4348217.1 radical SAM protein [Aestuariivita sp.]